MADFQLWNDKDERLADALARAYKHQMGVRTIHRLIQLWGVASNDFLLETETSIAADILTPTREKPRSLTITFIPDGEELPEPKPPRPKEKNTVFGFGIFATQPEPVELELEPIPYHLKLRREAIIRWFKERLLTKMGDSYDADDDIDDIYYLTPNPDWTEENETAVMRSLGKSRMV